MRGSPGVRVTAVIKASRSGVSVKDLVYYNQAVIRPVLQYACVAWHASLTKEQAEDVQGRSFQVILGNVSYDEACRTLNVSMLSDRRAGRYLLASCSVSIS